MVESVTYPTHPLLPAGFNADEINGDEANGAGTNWPIGPMLFDTFEAFPLLFITAVMLDAFDECADYTVPGVNDTYMIPHEQDTLVIRGRR
jgi:hypothetical protein